MELFEEVSGDNTPEFTVSEIAGRVKRLVESELGWVRVRGEVGRVVLARSGHLYFDLKDDRSVLSCMTWKSQVPALAMMPEEGLEVIAEGKMTASGFQSRFSLNAERIVVAGEGALMAMLERRKKELAAEGLFDEARRKPLPFLPNVIGVITSPQGVVIRDILHRLRERFPREVVIWPVAVQGDACAPEVAQAIGGFNALSPGGSPPRPDILIVARGGGSIEDLWGFNEEVVARAAAASEIPLVSAVGHETDTTLIDFAADRRAPTPTAAAEISVPVRSELLADLAGNEARLSRGMARSVDMLRQRITALARHLPHPEGLLADPRQRLDRSSDALPKGLRHLVHRKRGDLVGAAAGLRPTLFKSRLDREGQTLDHRANDLAMCLRHALERKNERLSALVARLGVRHVRGQVRQESRDLDRISTRMATAIEARLARLAGRLRALERTRATLGYKATLARGYAIIRSGKSVLTKAEEARHAESLEIEFQDGRIDVTGVTAASGGPGTSWAGTDRDQQT
ncbi:MAG: exodeoxyribonuclease VII large subunit [Boseongicola sp. SB0677_bin_26]|nr:exodeoxyribonuclease VII large subunit [Boseongicola sp. SB0665_bin_10]MYG25533.1 exodeoxyribonuclease VII large subunit [Boseongicola sp. SB0677_bin_26]